MIKYVVTIYSAIQSVQCRMYISSLAMVESKVKLLTLSDTCLEDTHWPFTKACIVSRDEQSLVHARFTSLVHAIASHHVPKGRNNFRG